MGREKGGSRMAGASWAPSRCLQTPPARTTTWVNVRQQGLGGVKNGKYSPVLPVGERKVGTH